MRLTMKVTKRCSGCGGAKVIGGPIEMALFLLGLKGSGGSCRLCGEPMLRFGLIRRTLARWFIKPPRGPEFSIYIEGPMTLTLKMPSEDDAYPREEGEE